MTMPRPEWEACGGHELDELASSIAAKSIAALLEQRGTSFEAVRH